MKNLKLILLLLLSPFTILAQQGLTGLWMGALTNDSNSVRKDQSFEIILTQYKEKVYGYSRSTFIVNDTLYYIVKRVKGTITGDICEVKDDHVVSHNFPKKPEKGVKVTSTFHRNKQDSTWYLAGDWKTKKTKKYYSVSGKVDLKGEDDFTASKLFPHLEELGLDKEVPFYVEAKKVEQEKLAQEIAKTKPKPVEIKKPTTIAPVGNPQPPTSTVVKNTDPEPKKIETAPVIAKNPVSEPAKVEIKDPVKKPEVISEPVASVTPAKTISSPPTEQRPVETSNKTAQPIANNKIEVEEPEEETLAMKQRKANANAAPPVKQPTVEIAKTVKTEPAVSENNIKQQPIAAVKTNKKELPSTTSNNITGTAASPAGTPGLNKSLNANGAAAMLTQRKTEAPQIVNYVSDSLVLILYDNGEVDGDTVSVLLNGQMFMPKQGLKTAAIKKTIYITPGNEEMTLVLYAENLGKYPPNTGLLVVYDGEERYQLRFSADFQKNASVMFQRKK